MLESSGDARPMRRPMRSVANVRICLILTHERFGLASSSVQGKACPPGGVSAPATIAKQGGNMGDDHAGNPEADHYPAKRMMPTAHR